jgi:hypothetical protein
MAKSKRRARQPAVTELDSVYLLKLVLYMVLGVLWLRIYPNPDVPVPIPVGALLALIFASHDHFAIDRKIEYAVILLAMFVGFWLPIGIDIML